MRDAGSCGGPLTAAGVAAVLADMTTVASDESRRDNRFRNWIMETSTYPTGIFDLSSPIDLRPASVSQRAVTPTGNPTLHGSPRRRPSKRRHEVGLVHATGSLPITFEDYGIANPSFGPAQVGDSGTLEFLLTSAKA